MSTVENILQKEFYYDNKLLERIITFTVTINKHRQHKEYIALTTTYLDFLDKLKFFFRTIISTYNMKYIDLISVAFECIHYSQVWFSSFVMLDNVHFGYEVLISGVPSIQT